MPNCFPVWLYYFTSPPTKLFCILTIKVGSAMMSDLAPEVSLFLQDRESHKTFRKKCKQKPQDLEVSKKFVDLTQHNP